MSNKLFITNRVPNDIFAKQATLKYSLQYFKKNNWKIKYFDQTWNTDLDKYDIILIWSVQQCYTQWDLKKKCLKTLIDNQQKYKYRILDYIEDLHRIKQHHGVKYDYHKKHFKIGSNNYILSRYA